MTFANRLDRLERSRLGWLREQSRRAAAQIHGPYGWGSWVLGHAPAYPPAPAEADAMLAALDAGVAPPRGVDGELFRFCLQLECEAAGGNL